MPALQHCELTRRGAAPLGWLVVALDRCHSCVAPRNARYSNSKPIWWDSISVVSSLYSPLRSDGHLACHAGIKGIWPVRVGGWMGGGGEGGVERIEESAHSNAMPDSNSLRKGRSQSHPNSSDQPTSSISYRIWIQRHLLHKAVETRWELQIPNRKCDE